MPGNTLVSMCANYSALVTATQVFDELPFQSVVPWTALIAGYVQQKQGQEALGCFRRMRDEGVSPNATIYACAVKACTITHVVDVGTQMYIEIANQGLLKKNVVLGGALVDMYAKCGAILKAQKVFDALPVHNVISWTALIAGYAQQAQDQEALSCFQQMCSQGFCPNAVTYACVLKACGSMQNVDVGNKIHDEIVNQGLLNNNVVLGGALMDMYAKCGAFLEVQFAFDALLVRNVVCWNTLIAGYNRQGQGQDALACFYQMRSQGFSPDAITYACVLKACGITQDADMGKGIHNEIFSQDLLKHDVVLGGALVDMYAKCGILLKAQKVFDTLLVRDVACWNALIAGYAQQGQGEEALSYFQRMRSQDFSPNVVTYACVLKACGIMQNIDAGNEIHYEIANQGLLNNTVLGGALVDMYAKCGVLLKAQKVFDALPMHNVISWSALIAGYTQQGQGQEALGCFQQMRSQGFYPNAVTYACVLKACGIMQNVDVGNEIHDEIANQGLLNNNVVLGGALVDMYAKCGAFFKAQKVFDALPVHNVVCWNALIAGYAQQGQGQEALCCFYQMRSQGFSPDVVTYACVLKACAIMQDADVGEQIHNEIVSQGLLENDVVLGGALVDMYAKCGAVLKAQKVVDALPVCNVVSWTALIAGYAQQGQGQVALSCFQRMRSQGFAPNPFTYVRVLKACGVMRDVDVGVQIHDEIVSQGLLKNNVVLGGALVDMYAKCGVLWKAQQVFDSFRVHNEVSWTALIAGYAQKVQV
ncbi:hypothetical protein GOP47_0022188 [Adiantum capillus-veneris]|uniref:Pentatricopeptide repeat-containing protein n=1 Tax=Adiantum capillus-veneris TaxID=13818 RepID=A0A9D4Z8K2_ADICA|nr:hypothetical protein GOP47_0022188 [Adiantum capillus-veneris]